MKNSAKFTFLIIAVLIIISTSSFAQVANIDISAATTPIASNSLAGVAGVGSTYVQISSFKLTVTNETANIDTIDFTPNWSSSVGLDSIDVFVDGASILSAPIPTANLTNSITNKIPTNSYTQGVGSKDYIIVATFSSLAADGTTFQINIDTPDSANFSAGASGIPTRSGTGFAGFSHTITLAGDVVLSAATTPISSNALAGIARVGVSEQPLSSFKLTVSNETVVIDSLEITPNWSASTGLVSIDILVDGASILSAPVPAGNLANGVKEIIETNSHTQAAGAKDYIIVGTFNTSSVKNTTFQFDVDSLFHKNFSVGASGALPTLSGSSFTGYQHTVTIPNLNLTNVTFNNPVFAETDTANITFTTYAALDNNDTLELYFPYDFSFDTPTIAATSSFVPTIVSSADSAIILAISAGTVNAGSKTLRITGVTNPSIPIKDGVITALTLKEGTQDTTHLADLTPYTFDIVGTLTLEAADNPITDNMLAGLATMGDTKVVLTGFKLTVTGENSILTQVKVTPTYATMLGTEVSNIDIYKDTNGDGYLDVGEPSIATARDESGSGTEITVTVSETVPIGSTNYLVVADYISAIGDGDLFQMDIADITGFTSVGEITSTAPVKSGSAITGYQHEATPPVINIISTTLSDPAINDTGSVTIVFTTNQALLNTGDEFVVTFPAGLDISNIVMSSGSSTQSGINPSINDTESSGQSVVLDINQPEPEGQFTFIFNNIINPSTVRDNVSVDIISQLDDDTLVDADDATPAIFDVVGKLRLDEGDTKINNNNMKDLFHTGGTNISVSTFKLVPEGEYMDIGSISFYPVYTGFEISEIEKVDIFEDINSNGEIDDTDSSITDGNGVLTANRIEFSVNTSGYTLDSDSMNYIVTVDLSGSVGVLDALKLEITGTDAVSVTGATTSSEPIKTGERVYGYSHLIEGIEIISQADTNTVEGKEIIFPVNYKTTGEGLPIISLIAPPGNAVVDSATFIFSWTPEFSDAGIHEIRISGSHAGKIHNDTLNISVSEIDVTSELIEINSTEISGSIGGTVEAGSTGVYTKHKVVIPPGALINNQTIIIKDPLSVLPVSEIDSVPSAVLFEVSGYSGGYTFEDSIDLTLEYKSFEVKNNRNNLKVHWWDPVRSIWKRLRGDHTINILNKTVTVKTNHFSVFGVIETDEAAENYDLTIGWNMICLPILPDLITDPLSFFADDIYPFRYEENNSNIYTYDESLGEWIIPTELVNGTGYILYGFDPVTVDISGLEESADITHTLSLTNDNGWHLLGNPFAAEIDWTSDVIFDDSYVDDTFYKWTSSGYSWYPGGGLNGTIESWQGFWVHTNRDNETFTIEYPGLSKRSAEKQPDFDWRINLSAESGDSKDIYNYLGTAGWGNSTYDESDIYELVPLDDEFITLYFPHTDWDINPGNFTQDIRQSDSENLTWSFNIETNIKDEVNLKWNIPEDIKAEFDISLIDANTGTSIDMIKQNEYAYISEAEIRKKTVNDPVFSANPTDLSKKLSAEGVNKRTFTITVKKTDSDRSNIPDTYFLDQNYPNPFNPVTNIKYGIPETGFVSLHIFNSVGQKIRTLVSAEKTSGTYTVMWDGCDNLGLEVSTGVYFYRIVSGEYTDTKKLLLIR
ncbi:T9SS type A sorting domain-containing protein [candidate division KSB1 bacterium]